MPITKKKSFHEDFARFYEEPTRDQLAELLRTHCGELEHSDFKEAWPVWPKLSRHILGLANSGGGGLIIGVAEQPDKTLRPAGLDTLTDKAVVINGIKKHLPEPLINAIDILDFAYDRAEYGDLVGKKFQALIVDADARHLPFVALADGEGIRSNAVYVRRGAATEEASHDELQRVINRRVETGYSSRAEIDLATHLQQLRALYQNVERYHVTRVGGLAEQYGLVNHQMRANEFFYGREERTLNPAFPKEDFERFIVKMIEKKKRRIEVELDVSDL